jgi:hypothetical protein
MIIQWNLLSSVNYAEKYALSSKDFFSLGDGLFLASFIIGGK